MNQLAKNKNKMIFGLLTTVILMGNASVAHANGSEIESQNTDIEMSVNKTPTISEIKAQLKYVERAGDIRLLEAFKTLFMNRYLNDYSPKDKTQLELSFSNTGSQIAIAQIMRKSEIYLGNKSMIVTPGVISELKSLLQKVEKNNSNYLNASQKVKEVEKLYLQRKAVALTTLSEKVIFSKSETDTYKKIVGDIGRYKDFTERFQKNQNHALEVKALKNRTLVQAIPDKTMILEWEKEVKSLKNTSLRTKLLKDVADIKKKQKSYKDKELQRKVYEFVYRNNLNNQEVNAKTKRLISQEIKNLQGTNITGEKFKFLYAHFDKKIEREVKVLADARIFTYKDFESYKKTANSKTDMTIILNQELIKPKVFSNSLDEVRSMSKELSPSEVKALAMIVDAERRESTVNYLYSISDTNRFNRIERDIHEIKVLLPQYDFLVNHIEREISEMSNEEQKEKLRIQLHK